MLENTVEELMIRLNQSEQQQPEKIQKYPSIEQDQVTARVAAPTLAPVAEVASADSQPIPPEKSEPLKAAREPLTFEFTNVS